MKGGGIYNNDGLLVASGCTFVGNKALGGAGGAAAGPGGAAASPGGLARGGVVYNTVGGYFRATNCSFMFNQALGGDGGGVAFDSAAGGEGSGGALYNAGGTVLLASCRGSNNRAASGRNSRLGGLNKVLARGGAIHSAGGELTLSQVELASNSVSVGMMSGASGGAIHQEAGFLKMTAVYLHDNRVEGGSGAGIGSPFGFPGGPSAGGALHVNSGSAEIRDSTFSKNVAVGGKTASFAGTGSSRGGAIFNAGTLNLQNSTLAGNEAFAKDGPTPSYGGISYGGGLYNTGGVVVLTHATVAANSTRGHAAQQGGGIYSTNGTVTLRNSIVANSPSGSNCFGGMVDGGHNISSDGSAGFAAPGSLNNTDPILGPLADYGGPTPTMALLAGSPAIDAADAVSCPGTDQRGINRPFGAGCDIGAFESSLPYTVLGRITGYTTPSSGIVLSAGSSFASTGTDGRYAVHGLAAGGYTVTPLCSEAVFLLSNQVVNLGPDVVGVDFHSYRSNALTMEHISSGTVRAVFAGEAGQTYRVLSSANLQQWDSYLTNTVQPGGIFDFFETNHTSPLTRFFEVVKP